MPTSPLLLLKGACWARQSFPPPFLSTAPILDPQKLLRSSSSSSSSSNNRERNFGERKCSRVRAMPYSSSVNSAEDNGALCNFKLNESTFLASLMPKKEIKADRFIEAHPDFRWPWCYSGVDPAAAGLQVTSDGKPKILDVIDCTGSGDIDTSNVLKADADGCLCGASGASLVVNSSWKNPSGEWHVGYKLVYELFTDTLTSRLKKERKKKWDEKHQEAIAEAVRCLDEFDKSYDDKGPVIDAVVWHDGELWRVALDTQNLEDDPERGKLAEFVPLTNYRVERKFGVFSSLDACSFIANVYDKGNILSIVTDCSPHGTLVAGIALAFHPKEPLLNGVAPAAQLISCKIGDARLGSMETGTGLTRAPIAAVEHKCDLINMSYGEPTLLPDYGRFVNLVDEVVNKHRLIFVSSAGNSGLALSTVGAPGGTTSIIIRVGAYVSPAMAAGAHCVVEPPSEGLEYTWSSRGATVDGDLGVCISAPGGAVAPVPTWTLQRRMLTNGTSMASPSACGGVALLVSAMKAEGIPVSPYIVREALENSSIPVGVLPEDKLTTGQGLMQVDKYQIKINQAGKSTPTSRGIYLRVASACQQSTEWTVQVEPKFHDDASNLEQLVPFEECIELHSSGKEFVKAPEYLLLTHNSRSFNIVVDPTNLSDGLHYYELCGIDCKAPWRGPVFRIPVTITKAMAVKNRPALLSFSGMTFLPGHIERKYIKVPIGASWVEATLRTSGFDTARRFFVDTVQISPLQRPMKWESVITFSSPFAKSFAFPVEGGRTMELVVAQFWSSVIGSHEATVVEFEIGFHGININKEEVVLDGSDAPARIDAEALLSSEKLAPAAILSKIRIPYRPIDAKLCTLPTDRDKLPSGKQILALTLTYKFKLEDGAERVYTMGDVYPNSTKLPKGEYNLQLYLRHDNVQYLEKMKQLVLFIERNLEDKVGVKEAFYVGPPTKDKLPKNSPEGSVLLGAISYGKLSFGIQEEGKNPQKNPVSHQISYQVPPNKFDEDKGKGYSTACTKSVSERLEEEVRDAKIKVLASLKQGTAEEYLDWKKLSSSLKSEYPKYTPLLAKILEGLLSQNNVEDKIPHLEEIIDAADEVIGSVYTNELAKYFSFKSDPEDEGAEKVKKKMETARDQLAEALYQKGLAMAEIESLKGEEASALASTEGANVLDRTNDKSVRESNALPDLFEENFKELKQWVDVKSSKYATLLVMRERRCGRLGTALKALNDMIQVDGEAPKKKLYELKLSLLDQIGWGHLVSYERQWMHV
ncbi:hypothetical protein ACSBR2_017734 [Camellia fascicularis]